MENYQINIWVFIGVIILVWILTASCVTNDRLGQNGADAIRTITRLEEQLSSADRRIEEITARAEDLEGNIDLFEQQFRIYVDTVREIRAIIREYETKIERATDEDEKAKLNSGDISNLFLKCEDCDDNSKV